MSATREGMGGKDIQSTMWSKSALLPRRRRIRMRLVMCTLAASVALVALAAASTGTASSPASPALAAMAVATADLAPGAKIGRQGYVKDSDFSLYYEREFDSGATFRGARFLELEADVGLARSSGDASLFLNALVAALNSKKGRDMVMKAALGAVPKDAKGALKLTFGRVSRISVGQEAVIVPMSMTALGFVRVPFTIAVVRVDRVVEMLTLTGMPGTKLTTADVAALLRVAAGHITAGLTPASVTAPTISGTPQSGATLSATTGGWTNNPISNAFAWLRCDAAGGNCQPIAGATASTYLVIDADVGSTLRVAVTAKNSATTSTAVQSGATAVVTPGVPSALSSG